MKNLTLLDICAIIVTVLIIGLGLAAPAFEAKSFNKCTNSNASYVDALFTQLRVENCKR